MSQLELALFAQAVVWLIVVGVFAGTRQASIYHPLTIYLLFHGIVFVVRPLLVYYLGFNGEFIYMRFEPSEAQWIRALATSSVGLMVFAATSIAYGWSQTRFRTPEPPP